MKGGLSWHFIEDDILFWKYMNDYIACYGMSTDTSRRIGRILRNRGWRATDNAVRSLLIRHPPPKHHNKKHKHKHKKHDEHKHKKRDCSRKK